MVEEKIKEAVTKAWEGLTQDEKEQIVGISGGFIALSLVEPRIAPLIVASLLVMAKKEYLTEATRKFAKSFEKHFGEPIHRAFEKLKEVI